MCLIVNSLTTFHHETICHSVSHFLSVTSFSHCDTFFTLRLTCHSLNNPFFTLWLMFHIETHFPHCDPYFTVWHIFQSVTHFTLCAIFFTLWQTFYSVTCFYSFTHIWHWPIFHTMTLPILLTVTHFYRVTHFSYCNLYCTLWPIFHNLTFFRLWPIFQTLVHLLQWPIF